MSSTPCTPSDLLSLSSTPLFSALSADGLERIAAISRVLSFDALTPLFGAGTSADAFFGVLSGTVHLSATTPAGQETIVAIIEAGDTFAEAALFGSGLYPVNGAAQPSSHLIRIDGRGFKRLLHEDKGLAKAVLASLFRRQADLVQEIRFLQSAPPLERLASYLLALIQAGAWSGIGPLPLAKNVIASRIGVEPESLSRAFARLQKLGLVTLDPDLRVEDADRLAAFCGEAQTLLGLA